MAKINDFFTSEKTIIGSRERLLNLLDKFSDKYQNNPIFLIAGSWGIEITSGKELEHDDIDLIILQDPPYYIDDANEIEEKCFNVIPLEINYLKENCIKKVIDKREVYVPNYNLQICLKLIGQLQENLPERAIIQLRILLESYKDFEENKTKKEINLILKRLIPEELDSDIISGNITLALKEYLQGKKDSAMQELIRLHSLINKSFRYQFEKRGLIKKIKISEK